MSLWRLNSSNADPTAVRFRPLPGSFLFAHSWVSLACHGDGRYVYVRTLLVLLSGAVQVVSQCWPGDWWMIGLEIRWFISSHYSGSIAVSDYEEISYVEGAYRH